MAREKISVRQQIFGFPDEDLKTSLHDEIVLWLKKNELEISKKILGWKESLDVEELNRIEARLKKDAKEFQKVLQTDLKSNLAELKTEPCWGKNRIETEVTKQREYLASIESWNGLELPPLSKIQVESKIEVPITRERYKSTDIVGYADIVYTIVTAKPKLSQFPKDQSGEFEYKNNFHLDSRLKWNIMWDEKRTIAFDAKSAIPSFGEIIRQLNTYKTFCSWPFYIVSPDAKFASSISNEGFGFIQYPDCLITHPK